MTTKPETIPRKQEKTQNRITLAVVSDLHAYVDSDAPAPSCLSISQSEEEPTQHPITGLLHLAKKKPIKADVLISCGDMGDKAHPAAIQYAWKAIQSIGQVLSARFIAAASGNHDLDSRHKYNQFDAKGHIQALVPPFPVSPDDKNDKYWARHFTIEGNSLFRVVILNSCAYHGTSPEEYEHGRISANTLDRLRRDLYNTTSPPVNILVCHHHPERHGEPPLTDREDYQAMANGPGLIDLLGSGDVGEWLVVHGHRHRPRLFYAQGTASAPIVLSAGSLCAHIDPYLQGYARNQFYIVEIDLGDLRRWGLCGTFRAWDWITGQGWIPAGMQSGLPDSGGFGYRESASTIAYNISTKLQGETPPFFHKWQHILDLEPRLKYIMPKDLLHVAEKLRQNHGLQVTEVAGKIQEIGKQS